MFNRFYFLPVHQDLSVFMTFCIAVSCHALSQLKMAVVGTYIRTREAAMQGLHVRISLPKVARPCVRVQDLFSRHFSTRRLVLEEVLLADFEH